MSWNCILLDIDDCAGGSWEGDMLDCWMSCESGFVCWLLIVLLSTDFVVLHRITPGHSQSSWRAPKGHLLEMKLAC